MPLCWLLMMAVHELGHVIGAKVTGATVSRVVLHPLTISRTDLSDNPCPLVVAWAGPILGALFPVAAFAIVAVLRLPGAYLLRFFAGFCLIANGAYLGVGSFAEIGDAGDLVRHGAAAWELRLFGVLTVPIGLFLWHRQGEYFGLGKAQGEVQPLAAWLCLAVLIIVLMAEVMV